MYNHFKGQSGFAKKSDKKPPFMPPGQPLSTEDKKNISASNELNKKKKEDLKRK